MFTCDTSFVRQTDRTLYNMLSQKCVCCFQTSQKSAKQLSSRLAATCRTSLLPFILSTFLTALFQQFPFPGNHVECLMSSFNISPTHPSLDSIALPTFLFIKSFVREPSWHDKGTNICPVICCIRCCRPELKVFHLFIGTMCRSSYGLRRQSLPRD